MILRTVGDSICSVCLDVEIPNTGGVSIPHTPTWFLRLPAYVLPEYSTFQAGSTLSLSPAPFPSLSLQQSWSPCYLSLKDRAIYNGHRILAAVFVGLRTAAKTWTDTLPVRPAFAVGAAVYESL